ncbi:MAG: DnaJ-class molecular chaperone with C-terminal Zn finger domain [Actinomycetia bacterium]|nr:DnaJ-class molecular chaperone with C-terminal Zn finger domain [Actinomycetes bacterium]
MTEDFYELLEVDRSATGEEIKRSYRALARQYHPDANPGDPEAESRFKEISVAYETLRDPEKRRQYDTFGIQGVASGMGGQPMDGFGISDLFDAFFGGDPFGGRRGATGPPRGMDGEAGIELTLEEAAFGITKPIDLRMPVECTRCEGSGCEPGTFPSECPTCHGSGEVRQIRKSILGQMVTVAACNDCGGMGNQIHSPCMECRGDGRVSASRTIDVEVPAGIDDGQRLRLPGRGPAGPRGGVPGDLYVGIHVLPHPEFERQGDDLVQVRRIGFAQAALGTQLTVETLDGEEMLAVPPGTQAGRIFRLKQRGVSRLRSRGRGDLLVRVDVEVPEKLSSEEDALLRQLAELRGEEVAPEKDHKFFSRIRSAFQ